MRSWPVGRTAFIGLTCWNESSNSVCLDTEIFTWLGKALDWGEKQGTTFNKLHFLNVSRNQKW